MRRTIFGGDLLGIVENFFRVEDDAVSSSASSLTSLSSFPSPISLKIRFLVGEKSATDFAG